MTLILSTKNVFEYLIEKGCCTAEDQAFGKIEPKSAKNFNLLLSLPGERQLLVKQEPYSPDMKGATEFQQEWRIQECVRQFPELYFLSCWLPEVLFFDADNSIIVFNYLVNYRDLADFYIKENCFPTGVAAAIGKLLALLHRTTLGCRSYADFFTAQPAGESQNSFPTWVKGLERLEPEIFGRVSHDGIRFFTLYQRFDSLGQAIAALNQSYDACCLTHNDLKLNNILLSLDWEQQLNDPNQSDSIPLRLIDWERSSWGDPAFDVGSIVTSYLSYWLGSLVVSKTIGIEAALRLAMTPLEVLQPSLLALITAYLQHFPEILERHPNFLQRVMQFAGLTLIQTILSTIQYQKSFDNTGICMLQVAKTLLCRPDLAITTVFGADAAEMIRLTTPALALNVMAKTKVPS